MNKTMSAEKTAHLYALLAWNSYTKEQAEEIVYNTEYDELNNITWAETSIQTAIQGIKEKLLVNQDFPEHIDWEKFEIAESIEVYDTVIQILQDIHDKWVVENPHKFNRGSEEKSNKNLFQHLPTALIGIEEISKDLMFLAPMLREMGLDVGEMDLIAYGAFKPSRKIIKAYNRYVEDYKEKNSIYSTRELELHIKDCINGLYSPLTPYSTDGQNRLNYMIDHVDILTSEVIEKNNISFDCLEDCTLKV